MFKVPLLLFASLLTIFSCTAQISYTSADFAVAGDTFLVSSARVDTLGSINFQQTGTNYTWNYATLMPQSQSTDRYLSAQSTGYKLSYTSACIASGGGVTACNSSWNSLVNLGHQQLDSLKLGTFEFSNVDNLYYKTTSALPINIVGMTFGLSGINFPLTFKYTTPDTVYRFPIAYNNQDSSMSSYAIDLTSLGINFIYKVSAKRVNTVEGWGSLVTPYKSYPSTLKLKTLIYSYDTLIYGSSTIPVPSTTSVTYSWFDATTQRPVLSVDGTVTGTATVYNDIEYIDTARCLNPHAQFTPDPLVPYLNTSTNSASVSFNNSSNNANQYSWNFGDTANASSNISAFANPSHTYSASGIYQVTLIACNSVCSPLRCDTFTEPITIFDSTNTQSSFTYTPLTPCIGDTLKFTNTSLNANSYKWNFGDNTTSTLKNPKKTYATVGTYTVQLIALGGIVSDTSYQQIQVSTVPLASISPSGNIILCSGDSVTLTASGGDYYVWSNTRMTNSITVRNAGTYTVTAYNNCGNAASAPDTITITSAVTPTISITASTGNSICPGSPVTFTASITNGGTSPVYQWKKNGVNVGTNTNTYSFTGFSTSDSVWCILTSNTTCTTTPTINSNVIKITLKSIATSSMSQSICPGTSYLFNGSSLPIAGTYRDTLTSANGCDSIVTLTLTVKPNSASYISQSICAGTTYTFHGLSLSTAGTYRDTLASTNGCDSIITLTLSVKPQATSTVNALICSSGSYTFGGQTYHTQGIYIDTLLGGSSNGCDSIVTLNLSANSFSGSNFSIAVCPGSSYTFNGVSRNTAGSYADTLTSSTGCDSIVTLYLSIKPNSSSSIAQSICAGNRYFFNGLFLTSTGTYRDTLTSANGCDSIVTLSLTVIPTLASNLSQSICTGSTYSFNGANLSTSGTYRDTVTSANGCDSIITLTLTIKPVSNTNISQSICQGSSYTFHGVSLSAAGIYRDTMTAVSGCDSIITLTLILHPISNHSVSASICEGTTYLFNGSNLSSAGTYYDTLTSGNGCDSINILILTVLHNYQTSISDTICSGSQYIFGSHILSQSGVYYDTLSAVGGCDSAITIHLQVLQGPLPVITLSGRDSLSTGAYASYQWMLNDSTLTGATSNNYIATTNGSYRVFVTDATGCTDTSASYNLISLAIKNIQQDIAFSVWPNPTSGQVYVKMTTESNTLFSLKMYDIWGSLLIERSNLTSSNINSQIIQMNDLASGIYFLSISTGEQHTEVKIILNK